MSPTVSDRIWYAIHCLPREGTGSPPPFKSLEARVGLPNATLSKLVRGGRKNPSLRTVAALAKLLNVSAQWLGNGEGDPPILSGPLPPRPGAGNVEAWRPEGSPRVRITVEDECPTRAPVIASLRADAEPEAIIEALLAERHLEGDPGFANPTYWWDRALFYKHHRLRYKEVDGSA